MKLLQRLRQRADRKSMAELANNEAHIFLRSNSLFKNIGDEAYLFLLGRLMERHYARDELIFKQDNPGVCLFVIKQGEVKIYVRRSDGADEVLATLTQGALFGEISVLTARERTATAKALENNTTLFALSISDLDDIKKLFPNDYLEILKSITDTLINNLVQTTRNLSAAQDEITRLRTTSGKHNDS